MQAVAEYQALEEAEAPVELMKLSFSEGNISNIYNTTREKVFMEKIIDELESHSLYEQIEVSQFLPELKAHQYHLLKKFKNKGLPIKKVTLYCKQYGYVYFLWKEDSCSYLKARQKTIDRVRKFLSNTGPVLRKRKHSRLSLIVAGKIASSQFRVLYQELTGDKSVADNKLCKEADERMQLILKTADETIIRDLSMKNGGHTKKFDAFWDVTEKKN